LVFGGNFAVVFLLSFAVVRKVIGCIAGEQEVEVAFQRIASVTHSILWIMKILFVQW
jgi:hypothetical protein